MPQALRIRVRGQVQGVGFRPFIWQLAQRFELRGQVLNDPEGVLIHVEGAQLNAFVDAIREEAPPLARIDQIAVTETEGLGSEGFRIAASHGSGSETRVTPDAATCPNCLAEIRDPSERRFGYAFANCTHCGPRFTILRGLPYDRAQTSMAGFQLCPDCQAEYDDPGDRRFHAQPIACPKCGPKLWLEPGSPADPIQAAAARLKAGEILAIKGLGGFHLACDATNPQAIAKLRARKHRPAKPFALMGSEAMIAAYAAPSPAEWQGLRSAAAPILLLAKSGAPLPDELAPGQSTLGWMLPYTPLHHLLLDAVQLPLVMTSGNLSGEPQAIDNEEARQKLCAFVDAFLMHDRAIARRLDDSVQRLTPHGPMVLRRARGLVPGTLPLPPGFEAAPQIAAYGGQMKAAICLLKNGQALLGHHLGELDDALTWEAFQQADRDYSQLFDHRPERLACDLHPDFRASRYAESKGLPLHRVQHHHAHLAACLGDNLWPLHGGKVAGIVLDGLGLGPDGTVWGGEVLLADYHSYERRAWLRPAPLPGGDGAQKEPWRNLLIRLDQAGLGGLADEMLSAHPLAPLRMAAAKGLNSPQSSSAGRLFDAFAAALGLCRAGQSFEGEAAMRLEALALQASDPSAPAYPITPDRAGLDPAPLFQIWARETDADPAQAALRFHKALAQAFAAPARALVQSGDAKAVALSGGCFQNALLLDLTVKALGDVPILLHRQSPANDGGLALGQALIAAAQALGPSESP